jgi:hypothetical protein
MKKSILLGLTILLAVSTLSAVPRRTRSLFAYTQVKYGLQLAPKPDGLSQSWLMGVEIHRQINPYMAVSVELMPFYRTSEKLASTLLAGYGFINLKAGIKPISAFGLYGGIGTGGRLGHSWVEVGGDNFTHLSLDWAWQFFGGVTIQFSSFSLLVEFHRLTETLAGLSEPNVRHYLMVGFGI